MPDRAGRQLGAIVVDNSNFHVEDGLADTTDLATLITWLEICDNAGFGCTVEFVQTYRRECVEQPVLDRSRQR